MAAPWRLRVDRHREKADNPEMRGCGPSDVLIGWRWPQRNPDWSKCVGTRLIAARRGAVSSAFDEITLNDGWDSTRRSFLKAKATVKVAQADR